MSEREPLPLDPIAEARSRWIAQGWAEASEGMAAVTSVMRAHQIFMQRIDATLRPLGLSFARYEVLMLLSFSRTGSLAMKRIGSRLQVHPTSVTSAVDRLVSQGFVHREADPRDRRAVLATITDEGHRVAEKATEALNAEVFSSPGLAPTETRTLVEVLTTLRAGAGDFRV